MLEQQCGNIEDAMVGGLMWAPTVSKWSYNSYKYPMNGCATTMSNWQ